MQKSVSHLVLPDKRVNKSGRLNCTQTVRLVRRLQIPFQHKLITQYTKQILAYDIVMILSEINNEQLGNREVFESASVLSKNGRITELMDHLMRLWEEIKNGQLVDNINNHKMNIDNDLQSESKLSNKRKLSSESLDGTPPFKKAKINTIVNSEFINHEVAAGVLIDSLSILPPSIVLNGSCVLANKIRDVEARLLEEQKATEELLKHIACFT